MPEFEPIGELHEGFSGPDATAPPWSAVREVLTTSEMFWLSTTRRDGRLHLCTGDREQKAVNLAAEPRCVLSTGTNVMNSGLDVVVEGTALRITDHATLQQLAKLWKSLQPNPLPLRLIRRAEAEWH
ncbi:hypothetical protein ACFYO1_19155 [Nocardia sp. NPDC006044]|uniref:hypothetical protein n=1 Tax=Nocardia sp. NPDC006044 TaxID=3364306 RepID=UPI0036849BA3